MTKTVPSSTALIIAGFANDSVFTFPILDVSCCKMVALGANTF